MQGRRQRDRGRQTDRKTDRHCQIVTKTANEVARHCTYADRDAEGRRRN